MEIQGGSAPISPKSGSAVPSVSVEITASSKNSNQYMVKIAGSNQEFPVTIAGKQLQPGTKVELPVTALLQSTSQAAEKSAVADQIRLNDKSTEQLFQAMTGTSLAKVTEKLSPEDQKIVQTAMQILKDMPPAVRTELMNRIQETIQRAASTSPESIQKSQMVPETPEEMAKVVRAVLTEILDSIPASMDKSSPESRERSLKLLTQLLFPRGSESIPQKGITPLRTVPLEILLMPERSQAQNTQAGNALSTQTGTIQNLQKKSGDPLQAILANLEKPAKLPVAQGYTKLAAVQAELNTIRPPLTGSTEPSVKSGPVSSEPIATSTNQPAVPGTGSESNKITVDPKAVNAGAVSPQLPGNKSVENQTVPKPVAMQSVLPEQPEPQPDSPKSASPLNTGTVAKNPVPLENALISKPILEKSVATLTTVLKSEPLSLIRYEAEPFRSEPASDLPESPLYQKIADKPSLSPEIIRYASTRFPVIFQNADIQKFAELFSKTDVPLDESKLISLEQQLRSIPEPMRNSPFVKTAVNTALISLTIPKNDQLFSRIISQIEPVSETIDRLNRIVQQVKIAAGEIPASVSQQTDPVKHEPISARPNAIPVQLETKTVPTESAQVTQDPKSVTQDPKSVTQDPKSVTQDPKSVTQDPKPVTQDPKPVTQDPKSVTQDPKSVTQDPKSVTQDQKSVTLDPKSGTLDPKSGTLDPKSGTLDPKSGTLDPKSGTLDPKSGTLDPKSGTLDPKSGTLDPKSGTLDPKSATQELKVELPKPQEIPESLKESANRLEKAVKEVETAFVKLFSGETENSIPKNPESLKKLGDSWGMFLENSMKKWIDGESKPEMAGVRQELKRMSHIITKEMVVSALPDKAAENSPLKSFLKDLGTTVTESIQRVEGGQILAKPNDTPVDRSQMLWIPVQVGQEWTRLGIEFRREKDPKGRKGTLGNHVAITMELKKMGEVNAELDLDANKQLRVKIKTVSPAALQWFHDHEEQIRQSLQNEKLRAVFLQVSGIRRDSVEQQRRPGDSFKVSG